MQSDQNLYDLIDMNNLDAIKEEVKSIAFAISPQVDFESIDTWYNDILRLFSGSFSGYRPCNTNYHDIFHTTDVLLASLRLVHGVAITGTDFSAKDINQIVLTAIMHDTGYIQRLSESNGTGARFTAIHIERSIDFISCYFKNGLKIKVDLEGMSQILRCTGLNVRINDLPFKSEKTRLFGFVLGTADLLGQMADRYYIEKLPILYNEFLEGGIPGFYSDFDLMQKTPYFYEMASNRLKNELGGINCFMKNHFHTRWNIAADLYAVAIERNLNYLNRLIESDQDYKTKAKRKCRFQDRLSPRNIDHSTDASTLTSISPRSRTNH